MNYAELDTTSDNGAMAAAIIMLAFFFGMGLLVGLLGGILLGVYFL